MVGRLFRITGTILVIAVGLVVPFLTTSAPASAQTVIDGCTIVSNPSPTNFTDCPGADFGGAQLSGVDLAYANLQGASFLTCYVANLVATCLQVSGLEDADLMNANLSGATFFNLGEFTLGPVGMSTHSAPPIDLSGANLHGADLARADIDALVDFSGANLSGANFTGDTVADTFTNANLSGANLTGASMDYTPIAGGPTLSASLTGANFTNTSLVPSSQVVTATSQDGAMAKWSTPPAIPGATPGSCTPASGSTFSLFSTTVTCHVVDHTDDVATGTFQVNVAPTTQYFTRIVVPSNGANIAGAPYLDAAAGDSPGVTKVQFELTGGTLSQAVIATATPTLFGWLAKWNTTTVPNGTYHLQSVATDANNNTDTSSPIAITVNNQPPVTAVLIPSNGGTISGATALFDASASSAVGIASVSFKVSGGALRDQVVVGATPTYYGWLAQWNTTTVANGTYSLRSVATDNVAETTTSSPFTVTVDNPAPTTRVFIPSNGATQSGKTALLDASASAGVTSVKYELTGGTLTDQVVATATPTYYGWLGQWNTTTVPNGTYTLQSVAAYSDGVTGTSSGVTVTVANPGLADLANSSFTSTASGSRNGCGIVNLTFDAVYPGSPAVGDVTLHIAGCVTDPYTYVGSFTIATSVGTLSGSAMGSITYIGDTLEMNYQINLSVATATGSFTGTTGTLSFSAPYETTDSVAVE